MFFKNDYTIVTKAGVQALKGSGVIVLGREGCLKEAHSQLSDQEVYE